MSEGIRAAGGDEVVGGVVGGDDEPRWGSFVALWLAQSQNAFNDNAVKFLLLPVGVLLMREAAVADGGDGGSSVYENLLSGLLALPFLLFSPLAGWTCDRVAKHHVIRVALLFQTVVFSFIALAAWRHSLVLATCGYFLLAVQSTFFSPAKLGITKELVGSRRLAFGNGLMQMGVILSILGGTILGGSWYVWRGAVADHPFDRVLLPLVVLACLTLVPLAMSMFIRSPVGVVGGVPFRVGILYEHFREFGYLWSERVRRLTSLGNSFFWFFGIITQLIALQVAAEALVGDEDGYAGEITRMMIFAGGGVAIGSVLTALVSRRGTELGLVPIGGMGMALSMVLLAGSGGVGWMLYGGLLVGGLLSAVFYVPLNAHLQDICPAAERGRLLATTNIQNNLFQILAVLLQLGMKLAGVATVWQFALVGLMALGAAIYMARLLPRRLVRFVLLSLMRAFYRYSTAGMPFPRQGGALVVSNHVGYNDSFLVAAACPRLLRFVVIERFYHHRVYGPVIQLMGGVPISATRARDAIRTTAEAVAAGDLVCIFPEGQLTRTGMMSPFRRGYALISRQAKRPVMPVYIDGNWGSLFSFSEGRYLRKRPRRWPYPVHLETGEVASWEEASVRWVHESIGRLGARALARRPSVVRGDLSSELGRGIGRGGGVILAGVGELRGRALRRELGRIARQYSGRAGEPLAVVAGLGAGLKLACLAGIVAGRPVVLVGRGVLEGQAAGVAGVLALAGVREVVAEEGVILGEDVGGLATLAGSLRLRRTGEVADAGVVEVATWEGVSTAFLGADRGLVRVRGAAVMANLEQLRSVDLGWRGDRQRGGSGLDLAGPCGFYLGLLFPLWRGELLDLSEQARGGADVEIERRGGRGLLRLVVGRPGEELPGLPGEAGGDEAAACYPILELPCAGALVALSLPHPPTVDQGEEQPGYQAGSWGRLLSGVGVSSPGADHAALGGLEIEGPALAKGGTMLEGVLLDEGGFLVSVAGAAGRPDG